ncbi:L-lysine 6-oxidase [Rhizobiales bacterium GAS191]|nr:L-lysine 6-oxidase [Rhizobiales bacterium GAS191]
MAQTFVIGPSIGVARLGNSPGQFYVEPETIAGLPLECDAQGNVSDPASLVRKFKDGQGRVRRQAARFRVFRLDGAGASREVTLKDRDIAHIRWTVHLANKKAAWYQFSELEGNLVHGQSNSYEARKVARRNKGVTVKKERQRLLIDPGPRTLDGPGLVAHFDRASVPANYKFASFPDAVTLGDRVTTLGEARTDKVGRLLVLGGLGRSGGNKPIVSFAGADTWHDDISDGPVTCSLSLKSGETVTLRAWCLVGSPKFVPEIANVTTLDDTMYDVAVRHLGLAPDMFSRGRYNRNYIANFDRDVRPILERPAAYRWVANIPSLNSLSPPPFAPRDASAAAAPLRQAYLAFFREPGPEGAVAASHNALFSKDAFPLMPLNSGSNSVSDIGVDKFLTLTETQYFLLRQWADGKFTTDPPPEPADPIRLSRASTGNCVGAPFCPGIEVTWSVRNPNIYDAPWSIRHRDDGNLYVKVGLDPSRDETADKGGCEPGDLTKRMAIPWQADFFECSVQTINFTDPGRNTNGDIPLPPTYYAYWWPPQSPWQVISGDMTAAAQHASGNPAGIQVMYSRGVDSFEHMIKLWSYLGFVANQATGPHRTLFPYFTEQERAHDKLPQTQPGVGANALIAVAAEAAVAPPGERMVAFETSRQRGRVPGAR